MSIASDIQAGLSKALSFFSAILTKTAAVDKTFTQLEPTTKAAILATFYDVTKTVTSASAVVGEATAGDIPGAITLSAATAAMVQNVITDGKADLDALHGIVSALKTDLTA